jgi:hypothetical protein
MEKERIIEISGKWNFWEREIDAGILREEYLKKLLKFIRSDKIISVVGVRRSGKSYMIRGIVKKLIEGGSKKENTLIVNFEEPEFEGSELGFLQKIYATYLEIIKPPSKPFIFLDEIQNVPKWERFVRSLNERKEAYLIVSGSSSKLLSEELATVLAGRQLYFEVFPLSFREFLSFRGVKIRDLRDVLLAAQKIKGLLREYLQFGGYPEVVLNEEEEIKIRILRSYFEDILTRDVIRRFKIKQIEKLRGLVRYYLTNISSPITFNSISKILNLPVETTRRFTSYLEISKSIFFLRRFSFSVKEQEKAARKVYTIDVGLSNAIGFRFSENLGRIAENLVAIELKRRQNLNPKLEICYWKDYDEKEVDFVIKEDLAVSGLIQICWDVSDLKTKKREIDAILRASKKLNCSNLLIITEDFEEEEEIKNKKIVYRPLWKFLCEQGFENSGEIS